MLSDFLWADVESPSDIFKWSLIKQYSNELFERCNWTQLPDSGLSFAKRLEWQAYRDTLRFIQDDFTSPDDVMFPTEPAEE